MTAPRDDWTFVSDAWRYALVLAGNEEAAEKLVHEHLLKVARRSDVHDAHRAQRLVFAGLYAAGRKIPASADYQPSTPAEVHALPFHRLAEPGRSAFTLLTLGLFSGEDLAGLLSSSESDLAEALRLARAAWEAAP
jgi:DNA-directed RNA polymerase specialized sigma24 family protein